MKGGDEVWSPQGGVSPSTYPPGPLGYERRDQTQPEVSRAHVTEDLGTGQTRAQQDPLCPTAAAVPWVTTSPQLSSTVALERCPGKIRLTTLRAVTLGGSKIQAT